MPISLKLLTAAGGEGKAAVEGSFKDLCDHFIDPGGLRQDPESGHYLVGNGEDCLRLIARWINAGAEQACVCPILDPVGQVRKFGEEVISRL